MVVRAAMDRKEELFMARNIVKEIRRAMRRKFSAEEKIRIVLVGFVRMKRFMDG